MSYNQYSGNTTKIAKEKLRQVSTFQVGDLFDWTKDPFADISFVGLRNWLTEIAGLDPKNERFNLFFKALDSYIDITSLQAIQNSSEDAKFNLLVASQAKKKTDTGNRRPLFELAPRSDAGK